MYILKPGFEIVSFRQTNIDGKYGGEAVLFRGNPSGITAGEKVYYSYGDIQKNYKRYRKLMESTQEAVLNEKEINRLFNLQSGNVQSGKNWEALEALTKIIKGTENQEVQARAYFLSAMVFKPDMTAQNRSKTTSFDIFNQREILLYLVKNYPQASDWVKRAYYNLAYYYDNAFWKSKNETMYRYLKLSGKYGATFFDYGKNILKTMDKDSILFTEGGDNQVFSLQTLLQIEKLRPDVTVFDQMGNIFDPIFGNLKTIDHKTVEKKKVEVVRSILEKRLPPKIGEIWSFIDEKMFYRKRTGQIYFTWVPEDLINEINQLSNKSKQWALEPYGILYVAAGKGEKPITLFNNDQIWGQYSWSVDKKEWPDLPYMMKEILISYYLQYSDYLLKKNNLNKAVEALDEVLRIAPDSFISQYLVGLRYIDMKNYEKAGQLLMKSIDLDQKFWGAYSSLFGILFKQMFDDPALEKKNLALLDQYLTLLKKSMDNKDFTQDLGPSKRKEMDKMFKKLEDQLNQASVFTYSNMLRIENELVTKLETKATNFDIPSCQKLIMALYMRGSGFLYTPYLEKADKYLSKLLEIMSSSQIFNSWALNIAGSLEKYELANKAGRNLEKINQELGGNFLSITDQYWIGLSLYKTGSKEDGIKYLKEFIIRAEKNKNQYRAKIESVKDIVDPE